NDRIRVLEYRDRPGDRTSPHRHPDSVMYTLSSFRRRVTPAGRQVEVDLAAGQVRWLDAPQHTGENIGRTDPHSLFIDVKEPRPAGSLVPTDALGPSGS